MELKTNLTESVQMIHLGPDDVLTSAKISDVLRMAKIGYTYARFYTDDFFIQVNYVRDGSISVSSNIRNTAFLQEFKRKESYGWNEASVRQFVYQWMQLSRKTMW